MTNLFTAINKEVTLGARGLQKTAELTAVANEVVNKIFIKIDGDESVEMRNAVQSTMQTHDAMDEFLKTMIDFSTIDLTFLQNLDDNEIDRMIKSQQSKRSRAKSKQMTLDNYKSMMAGAVAENLLRLVSGKEKSSVGYTSTGDILTDEELEKLANDQEALRRAIRNVQSKKSIAKSKANFNPESERWLQLLKAEEQLKSIRVGTVATKVVVDNKSVEIQKLLAQIDDIDKLKAADSKDLLSTIKNMLGGSSDEL